MDMSKVFAPNQSFEQYSERFKDFFTMRRENGIIEVRMHENGGPTAWKKEHNMGWGAVLKAVGADPENEVLIIGGTGDVWAKDMKSDGYAEMVLKLQKEMPGMFTRIMFDNYQRVSKNMHAMLFDLDIPTIGVINGPSDGHMEMALLCDINLCAPNVEFRSIHFAGNGAPGDSFFAVMQNSLGLPRSNYLAYTGKSFSAEQAQKWGMVNELVPSEEIYARAWELAKDIMKKPRTVRRLTHDVMRRPVREYINDQFGFQAMAATLAGCILDGN